MKNSLFTIVLLTCGLAFYEPLSAQTKFGLSAGYVLSHWNMPNSNSSPEEGKWGTTGGWQFSVPVEHSISKTVALQGGLTWIEKGASVTIDANNGLK